MEFPEGTCCYEDFSVLEMILQVQSAQALVVGYFIGYSAKTQKVDAKEL